MAGSPRGVIFDEPAPQKRIDTFNDPLFANIRSRKISDDDTDADGRSRLRSMTTPDPHSTAKHHDAMAREINRADAMSNMKSYLNARLQTLKGNLKSDLRARLEAPGSARKRPDAPRRFRARPGSSSHFRTLLRLPCY